MSDIDIKIKVVSDAAEKAIKDLGAQTSKTESQFKQLNLSINNTTSAFKVFLGNIAATAVNQLAGSLKGLVGSIVQNTSEVEDLSTQLEVLTGSAGSAGKLLKELQDFSAKTPFQLQDIGKASSQLLAFGFAADEVQGKLQRIGDVAAASGQPITEISQIFGQVSAAGKLTGERLLQLQERAVPIGAALAQTMGVAENAVRDLVSKGKVDFATFEKAFNSLSDQGGVAFEGMIKRSKTLSGVISTLKDNFALVSSDIGQQFLPIFKAAALVATEFLQSLKTSPDFQKFIKDIVSSIPSVISGIGVMADIFVKAFNGIKIVINGLEYVWFKFIESITEGVIFIQEASIKLQKFLRLDTSDLEKSVEDLKKLSKGYGKSADDAAFAMVKISDSNVNAQSAIEGAVVKINDLLKEQQIEQQKTAQATVESTQQRKKAAVELTQAELEEIQKRKEAAVKAKEEQLTAEDAYAIAKVEALFAQDGIIQDEEKLHLQELADARATAREEEMLAAQREVLDKEKFAVYETKVKAEQIKRQSDLNKARYELDKKQKEQELKDNAQFYQNLTTVARLGGKEIFAVAKGFQTAQATIAGFSAIQQAASAAPWPANLPGIIAETARMVTNVRGIQAQSFESGGIVGGNSFSGDRVPANVNSGEMILNRQQQTQLFNLANGSGSGSGQPIEVHTNVSLDGEVIAKAVSIQVANGFKLGEQT